jgi:hypothetical protein
MSIMSQFGQSVEVVEEIPKKLKKGRDYYFWEMMRG